MGRLALSIWPLELMINKIKQNYLKQRDQALKPPNPPLNMQAILSEHLTDNRA